MDTKRFSSSFFRQLLFLIGIIFLGIIIYSQLNFLFGSFLGAIAIYVMFRPLAFKLVKKRKWNSRIVSVLLVLITTLVFVSVAYSAFVLIITEIYDIDIPEVLSAFSDQTLILSQSLGVNITESSLAYMKSSLLGIVSNIINTSYNILTNLLMMLVWLYFMFTHAEKMEGIIYKYSPFKGESMDLIKKDIKGIIQSNAIVIPVIILFQSLAAALGYWLLGINNIPLWALLTGILGTLPIVGSALIWVPMGLYLISMGSVWPGVLLILYGFIIISNIDNVCRLILMKKMANTHPLITILGIILGIPLFGFWGIIFGPLLISFFLLLIKIYYTEYSTIAQDKTASSSEIVN